MSPKGTELDTTIKVDLIELREDFFKKYQDNLKIIKKLMFLTKTAPRKLKKYESLLEKHAGKSSARLPIILSPEEERERKVEKFARVIDEIKNYLNGELLPAISSYENQIIRPLKNSIPGLKLVIARIREQTRERFFIPKSGSFTKSDLSSIEDLLRILEHSIEGFRQDLDNLMIQTAVAVRYQATIGREKTIPFGAEKEEVLKKYKIFLKEAEVLAYKLAVEIENIAITLNALDKIVRKVIDGLH